VERRERSGKESFSTRIECRQMFLFFLSFIGQSDFITDIRQNFKT